MFPVSDVWTQKQDSGNRAGTDEMRFTWFKADISTWQAVRRGKHPRGEQGGKEIQQEYSDMMRQQTDSLMEL